jgi:hypothetical protein
VSAMKKTKRSFKTRAGLPPGASCAMFYYGSGQAIFSIAEKPGASHCS